MFTVLHLEETDLDGPQRLYQTERPIYWKSKDSLSFLEISTDEKGIVRLLETGTAIVMNDNGKTVAKYKLG
ncbi:hypothetical protein UFOVP122_24 [uncultured Caudovirales phage]|jgi:hypothetical protein|uniref:Uncharacterized protein n=1 Tax=uncultured Caudovirales phage TaxID=2100421 RepID=A0A6J5LB76_9CAUD|nr:hypothetical protein UFOVP122_24 [uncultured Caudovirales phage]